MIHSEQPSSRHHGRRPGMTLHSCVNSLSKSRAFSASFGQQDTLIKPSIAAPKPNMSHISHISPGFWPLAPAERPAAQVSCVLDVLRQRPEKHLCGEGAKFASQEAKQAEEPREKP